MLYPLSQYKLRLRQLETPHRAHRGIPYARESWEVLDCSEDDEGGQIAGVKTRAPVPVVVRD